MSEDYEWCIGRQLWLERELSTLKKDRKVIAESDLHKEAKEVLVNESLAKGEPLKAELSLLRERIGELRKTRTASNREKHGAGFGSLLHKVMSATLSRELCEQIERDTLKRLNSPQFWNRDRHTLRVSEPLSRPVVANPKPMPLGVRPNTRVIVVANKRPRSR